MSRFPVVLSLVFSLASTAFAQSYSATQRTPPAIDAVNALPLWRFTRGEGVNVAVIDTGIDFHHEEIRGNYAGGWNAVYPLDAPDDSARHGTHIAGIIAAGDNSVGIVGIAPKARIWSVKIFDLGMNEGTDEYVTRALQWVLQKKAEVGGNWIANMSFSGNEIPTAAYVEVIRRAHEAGILMVGATGNGGTRDTEYPSWFPEVLAVGALDEKGQRASFSGYGPQTDLVAPGIQVLSALPLGTVSTARLRTAGISEARPLIALGSPTRVVEAPLFNGGRGSVSELPAEARGKIVLIERSSTPIHDQIENAAAAGAVGVVVFNADDTNPAPATLVRWTCDSGGNCGNDARDTATDWPVVVTASRRDGLRLVPAAGSAAVLDARSEDYGTGNGTSVAVPHVTGAAALLWALKPTATANEIADALTSTARDLGPGGWDEEYGFGTVDAFAAAKKLAPAAVVDVPRKRAFR